MRVLQVRMSKYVCGGGCKTRVIRSSGRFSFCAACFFLHETLLKEDCSTVRDLLNLPAREFARARIADLLRRSCVDDAESLIATLDK